MLEPQVQLEEIGCWIFGAQNNTIIKDLELRPLDQTVSSTTVLIEIDGITLAADSTLGCGYLSNSMQLRSHSEIPGSDKLGHCHQARHLLHVLYPELVYASLEL